MSDGMTEAYRGWPDDYKWPDDYNRPPHSGHYEKLTPEPIAVIEQWELNFNLGNAVKYIARCDYKGQRKADLEKAIYYLRREIGNNA